MRYIDKHSGNELYLQEDYVSSASTSRRMLKENKYGQVIEEDKRRSIFTSYDIIASSIPEFKEPTTRDRNKSQFNKKMSKCLSIIEAKQSLFSWNESHIWYCKEIDREVDRDIDIHLLSTINDAVCYGQISTRDRVLNRIFSTPMQIHNAIKTLEEIGCISLKNDSYVVGKKAKEYFFYKNNIHKFKEWCKERGIESMKKVNQYAKWYHENPFHDYTKLDKYGSEDGSASTVIWDKNNKSLRVGRVNIARVGSMDETEHRVLSELYYNYPQVLQIQQNYDYIYKTYYPEGTHLHYIAPTSEFTFEWDKSESYIKKIGYRETNPRCSVPKVSDDPHVMTRQDVLDEYGLTYEYDVKSSIPRISYLIKTGIWLDEDVDIYELIYNHYLELGGKGDYEWNKETRDTIKYAVLVNGFNSRNCCGRDMCNKLGLPKGRARENITADAIIFHDAITDIVGELESELFIHESCIYHNVLYRCLERGYRVWLVYDGFYMDEEPDFDMRELVKDEAERYFSEWIEF